MVILYVRNTCGRRSGSGWPSHPYTAPWLRANTALASFVGDCTRWHVSTMTACSTSAWEGCIMLDLWSVYHWEEVGRLQI